MRRILGATNGESNAVRYFDSISDVFLETTLLFPFALNGSVRLSRTEPSTDSKEKIARRIEDLLDDANATSKLVDRTIVQFKFGLFDGFTRWDVLAPFDSGQLAVEDQLGYFIVRYNLSTTRMLLIVVGMVSLVALITWQGFAGFRNVTLPVVMGGLVWLFGMNYLIAAIRFPIWLRSGLRNVPPI